MLKTEYRIAWQSKFTGYESHGAWYGSDEYAMLKQAFEEAKREYLDLDHWIEERTIEKEPTDAKQSN